MKKSKKKFKKQQKANNFSNFYWGVLLIALIFLSGYCGKKSGEENADKKKELN